MTTALDVKGRDHLVIVIKASWQIPLAGQRPRPIAPGPLLPADDFYGEPGMSAMRYGSDFARFKPRCDILLDASAHAPEGEAVRELLVGFKFGKLQKGLKVLGPRTWRKRLGMLGLSDPEPFTRMPLHFGMAFGGTREYKKSNDKVLSEAHLENPSGIGWFGPKTRSEASEMPAPSLEAVGEAITSPTGKYKPTAFSAIGRHWQPRPQFAGTYDAKWLQEVCPFLPEDFDEQYHQCAPLDQQIAYPTGGEEVVLANMMLGRSSVHFKMPKLNMQVRILRKDYTVDTPTAVVDTLYFEPDKKRFSAVWRVSVPIKRRIHEFSTVAIGPVDVDWWHNKIMGLDGEGCARCGPSLVTGPEEAE